MPRLLPTAFEDGLNLMDFGRKINEFLWDGGRAVLIFASVTYYSDATRGTFI